MNLQLEATWTIYSSEDHTVAAELLEIDGTVTISAQGGNYSQIIYKDANDKEANTWTIEHQSVDNIMICGGVNGGKYTFIIARYPMDCDGDLHRIVGYISPKGFHDGPSEKSPGFWYALDHDS